MTGPEREQAPLIAVLDDDTDFVSDMTDALRAMGFRARGASSSVALWPILAEATPDLVLLDLGLDGEEGADVARRLRQDSAIPVVIFTARPAAVAAVDSLAAGGDAFLTKGCDLSVVGATIRAVLRRRTIDRAEALAKDGTKDGAPAQPARPDATPDTPWRLLVDTRALQTPDDQDVPLTHHEYALLRVLMENRGAVCGRDTINARLDRPDTLDNARNLDSLVRRCRKKVLQNTGKKLPVQSMYAKGYTFFGSADICEVA